MAVDLSPSVSLIINAASDADEQEVEELTQLLFAELEQMAGLDVARVSSGNVPRASKAIGAYVIGQLAPSGAHSGGVLVTVIGAIKAWLLQRNARSVVIEIDERTLELGTSRIEIKGVSTEEQRRLVESWVQHIKRNLQ
ncbi:hypothetical protein SAMN05446927_4270 [Caballeronia arationis]|uniref:Uncharacterized protein n=1 Tax=Caballeronia arationis TaxID=1777142 RepID=A0A7Z7IAI3_9BURK|nr:hypothetical protein [Caballeronia arationis]SOE81016.1 hypothetical protein SAMN05446927_4270 [Caballeronia arationis]